MIGMIGKKTGMSRIFDDHGNVIPVTIIEAGPCYVMQVKTSEKDGYNALQIGFGKKKQKQVNKPENGHFQKAKLEPLSHVYEFRDFMMNEVQLGKELKVDLFSIGDKVDVKGVSKGKGFQGVIRRHHFGGGAVTHGQSDRLRAPGSIGGSSYPSRVFKGQRMAGRMGHDNVTVKNLKIVRIDLEHNLIYVKGSIPGHYNGIVKIVKK